MNKRIWLISFIVIVLLGAIIVDVPPVAKFLGITSKFTVHQGLDLQGGTHLVYQTDLSKVSADGVADAATGVVEVIRRRIDALGVTEPTIQKTRDNSRVIVELPGVQDVNEAIKLIGETAQLEFKEAIDGKSWVDGSIKSYEYADWKDTGLTGANFQKAEVQFDNSGTTLVSKPQIGITFNEAGRKLFAEVTGRNIEKPLAIFLDKNLLSAPTVQGKIDSDSAVITGNFNVQEAKQLAIQLNAGALPVPIELVSQSNIGATLGTESVQKSVVAGLIGLLLVILFMLFLIMGWLQPGDRMRIWLGLFGVIAGLGLGYMRSGRVLREDGENIWQRMRRREVTPEPVRQRKRKRHGIVAGVDVK